MSITKAIIPAAGFGTRFLPATKAQPKEMLPVLDKPVIQYIVEEAVASGIKDIIFVVSHGKEALENHFDINFEIENKLVEAQKKDVLKEVRKISKLANFIYVRQDIYNFYGNGAAVLCAEHIINKEPFAVLWGDDLFDSKKPRLKQLIEVYEKYKSPVLTAYEVDDEGTNKYGIIDGEEISKNVIKVKSIIEKPGPEKALSRIASLGGFILTPDIFPILEKLPRGKGGELWLVDAIFRLMKKRPVYARKIEGNYYDTGSPLGWLKTNVEFALKHSSFKQEFRGYLKGLNL
ncbi:UTP--glucose-1-phosphate uridylyltransferase GalU [Patescibacteria group bacterium]|nr:UTP--glucose-1-phosphate uridylyltransferase GalU [Patescibacteria group bacterium]MBU4512563.1 UTP--glucose-1-phosphate uridylyltransferase GalU [Patescibacteria group bacterium]MCG2692977.1 UTP--glucose-1-phosphate uridylyltransferase GalU [Candidatus Parcubacteria bacterium]